METSQVNDRRLLTGMFADRQSTESAYNTLHDRGYTSDDIHVVMSDDTRKKHFSNDTVVTELGSKAGEGAAKGGAIGGTIGAVAAAIAAIGTAIAIPGLGIVVAGPILAGLAGAGAGAAAGGLVGGLIGAGIPEERAKIYESGVKKGHIVLGVHPRTDEDADYLESNWRDNRATEIYK